MKSLRAKWWLIFGAALLVLGVIVYNDVFTTTFPPDANLVRTERSIITGPPGGGLPQRVYWKCFDFKDRLIPKAKQHHFAPVDVQRCPIQNYLIQCAGLTSAEYLIQKELVTGTGTVMFGHTNVLNGLQWVQAFEEALQQNSPQWWDSEKKYKNEPLVLLRYNKKTILVLTQATAQRYREQYPKLAPLER